MKLKKIFYNIFRIIIVAFRLMGGLSFVIAGNYS